MDLIIKHYKDGEVTGERWSDYSLEGAKDVVCRWVREGGVDRVEIRDAADDLLFEYPQESV